LSGQNKAKAIPLIAKLILILASINLGWADTNQGIKVLDACEIALTSPSQGSAEAELRRKLERVQPMVDREGTDATVRWGGLRTRIAQKSAAMGESPNRLKELTVSIWVNGIEKVKGLKWNQIAYNFHNESPGQVDYYIVYKRGDEVVDISEFALKETRDGQNVQEGSFQNKYAGELFGIKLNGSIENLGLKPELTKSAVRLGYKKVVWVLSPEADTRVIQFIHDAKDGVDVRPHFGATGSPDSVTVTERNSGRQITARPDDFFFKVDAAFNGNAFYWDDMLTALATVPYHPWLVQSTIRFWLMVQKRNGGTIPREVRKESLISLWWPNIIHYGEKPKPNLTFTNPYLMNWVMDDLYRNDPSAENLALLKQVAQSITDYSAWMEANRAVRENGKIIGFNGSALGSGADNSRGRLGNSYEDKAYQTGFVDIISQQMAMYNDLRRWKSIFARTETDVSEKRKLLDEANAAKAKADEYRKILNERYWNQEKAFYFDLIPDGNKGFKQNLEFMPIAGFWPLYAAAPTRAMVQRIFDMQLTPEAFGGDFPLPANARYMIIEGQPTDPLYIPRPNFRDEDGYWDKWAHWPPMMLVAVEGFRRCGRADIAYDLSVKILDKLAAWSTDTVEESYGEIAKRSANGRTTFEPRAIQHSTHPHREGFAGWGKDFPIWSMLTHAFDMRPTYDGIMNWDLPMPMQVGDEIAVNNRIYLGGVVNLDLKKVAEHAYRLNVTSEQPFTLLFKGAQTINIQGHDQNETFTIEVPERRMHMAGAAN
jgi:hypothetical protein